jgi:hypothetical protein
VEDAVIKGGRISKSNNYQIKKKNFLTITAGQIENHVGDKSPERLVLKELLEQLVVVLQKGYDNAFKDLVMLNPGRLGVFFLAFW